MQHRPSMYEILVKNPEDVVSALSYMLYKQHKLEVMANIEAEAHAAPTDDDIKQFYQAASAPAMIDLYRRKAKSLSRAFLMASLNTSYAVLEASFTTTQIGFQLDELQRKLNERRTWKRWLADALANLSVNFITILLIAAAVTGYRTLDQLNGRLSQSVGVVQPQPPQPAMRSDALKR